MNEQHHLGPQPDLSAGDVSAQVVNLVKGGARDVFANTVTITQGGAREVKAESVTIRQGGAEKVKATHVTIRQGGAEKIEATNVTIRQSAVAQAKAETVEIVQSVVAFAQADEVTLNAGHASGVYAGSAMLDGTLAQAVVSRGPAQVQDSAVMAMVAPSMTVKSSIVGLLFARHVEGDVTAVFGPRAAVAFGAAFGAAFGVAFALARAMRKK
jgi:hypothetical protein